MPRRSLGMALTLIDVDVAVVLSLSGVVIRRWVPAMICTCGPAERLDWVLSVAWRASRVSRSAFDMLHDQQSVLICFCLSRGHRGAGP